MTELTSLSDAASSLVDVLRQNGLEFVPASPTDEPPVEAEPPDPDRARDDRHFDGGRHECYNVEPARSVSLEVGPPDRPDLFTYFLDGSLRTSYWGDVLAGGRTYPVLVSEIAVGVVERRRKEISTARLERRLCALFPFTEAAPAWSALRSVTGPLEPVCLEREPEPGADLRQKLAAKARERLHHFEAGAAAALPRSQGEWLVIDGDLRDSCFLSLREVVGLAKSFSLRPVVTFRELAWTLDLPGVLRKLLVGCRTPVLAQRNSEYRGLVFWYLRLWPAECLDNYLQGVVKVETVLPGSWDAAKAAVVQELSAALFAERFPCVYPERRWHAHIYPVHAAELLVKSTLLPSLVLRQLLFLGR